MIRKKMESQSDQQSDKDSIQSNQPEKIQEFNWKELPSYACSYCGIHQINSVVRCSAKNCMKWFCNHKGKKGIAAHIIIHLVKAKHNEISLHPQSQFGQIAVQCYICGNANVFVLGFVNIKDGQDSTVLILCRTPCVQQKKCQQLQWDPKSWNPLIQEKQLINWMAQKPGQSMINRMRDLDFEQIIKLQESWKTNPNVKYEDINKKKQEKRLKSLLLKYSGGQQYRKIFQALLNEQANSDKKIKQSQTQNNITVRFQQTPRKKLNAYFVFASKQDYDTSLLPGNELKLSIKTQQHDWSSKGVVVKIMGNEQVCLELFNSNPPPIQSGYKVQFVWKSTSYHRMKKGLKRFSKQQKSISVYLYYKILGQARPKPDWNVEIPNKLSAPGLPVLNFYQQEAVKRALAEPLCLIQGPPGTGKTITSASIVYQLVCNMRNKGKKGQVLVCAPSNVVVDMLSEKIHQTGLKVVRFCSKSRQSVSSSVQFLTLHNLVKNLKGNKYQKLKGYFKTIQEQKHLTADQQEKYNKEKKKAETDVLNNADVICCTCITSADRRIRQFIFHHVLIDQATQAIQPQCLLPMLKSAKQVILVGDHLQLGPVVICRETAKAGLNRSLFERLVMLGHRPIRLQVQYRMHPNLTFFPSNTFYQGTLQNGITQNERKLNTKFPWPENKPLFFLNLYGNQQISASGTSYLNRTQAAAVQKIVFYLEKAGIAANQMGIITPYKGQRAYIINYLQKNGQLLSKNPNFYKQIQIASVDGYQGRQKDYIIISCVRSNEGAGIGFLTDPRRLNVTITRAKYGMIVIGNAKVLYRDNLWNNFLTHFKSLQTLVEGTIPNFRVSQLSFPAPQKYIPERKNAYGQEEIDKDSASIYNEDPNDNLNNFDFLNQIPITSGLRYSALGYRQIPEVAVFPKSRLFQIFSKKEVTEESFIKNGEFVIPNTDLGLD